MKRDMEGRAVTGECLVSLVSGPDLKREQFIEATPLEDQSGYNTGLTLYNQDMALGIAAFIIAILADTPSVNWGAEEGAVYHYARLIGRPLLFLQCLHHVMELMAKRVKKALRGRHSTAPTDVVVSMWQKNYNSFLDQIQNGGFEYNVFDWDRYQEEPAMLEAAHAALTWARRAMRDKDYDPKGEYTVALKNLLTFLGVKLDKFMIHRPAQVRS